MTVGTWQSNILIGDEKQVQLADFGLLLLDDSNDYTVSNDQSHTIHWVPPDRIEGLRRTREDDIWALGCIGYTVRVSTL
jgi:serine/threonine protein kinase